MLTFGDSRLIYSGSPSRVLIVGVNLIPVMLIILITMPAVAVMPFTRNGWIRVESLLSYLISWIIAILSQSRV